MMNHTSKKLRLLLLIGFLSASVAQAQIKVNFGEIKSKYPNDEILLLNEVEKVKIDVAGSQLRIEVEHQEDNLFLNEQASRYADRKIHYSDFYQEIYDIEAATFVPDGNRFRKVNITDIKTEKPSSRGIFYDDSYVKKFAFEGAQKGSIGTMRYKEKIKDPHTLSGFMFGRYIPVQNAEFSVTFPKAVKVTYKTFGDFKNIEFSETATKGGTTYTWRSKDIKAYPYESDAPNIRFYAPQVFLYIEKYTIGSTTTEVLSDEQKLFNFYVSLVKDVNKEIDPQLKALVDSLTAGKSETEKIKSVYYWVQDHVKYIAFEDGLGGLVPRSANTVYQKRYGDCKDMANIITTMLKLAGVPANIVWIGTREIPYKYSENPSLGVDNHMIAAVKQDNQWVFLDATADKIDFGLPASHIQGKQGMVMLSEKQFTIAEVPVADKARNYKKDTIEVIINGTAVEGKGQCAYDGLWKLHMKYSLANYSEADRDKYYKALFSRGNNKCKLENVTASRLEARDIPLAFQYSFKVPDFVRSIDQELFLNPHLSKPLEEGFIEDTRKLDVEHDFTNTEENTFIINIPKGYTLSSVPEEKSFENEKFGFRITYKTHNNKLLVNSKWYLNTLLVKKEDFSEWNKMIGLLNDAYNESISLRKQ